MPKAKLDGRRRLVELTQWDSDSPTWHRNEDEHGRGSARSNDATMQAGPPAGGGRGARVSSEEESPRAGQESSPTGRHLLDIVATRGRHRATHQDLMPRGRRAPPGRSYRPVGAGEQMLRQSRLPWHIISPHSSARIVWDYVGDALTTYVAVFIPLFLSFQHIEKMTPVDYYLGNALVDVLFMLDFALQFVSAYEDPQQGVLVTDLRLIAKRFSRTYLLPDAIAAVPVTLIVGTNVYTIMNKLARLVHLPQTLKLVRLVKRCGEKLEGRPHQHVVIGLYSILKVSIYIVLALHWVACGWHFLADVEADSKGWISKDGLEGAQGKALYVASLYWAVTTISTVGYGDITGGTSLERFYCTVVMLTGATVYALAIGSASHVVASVISKKETAENVRISAETFLRMHPLPKPLTDSVRRRVHLSGQVAGFSERQAEETLSLLPAGLKVDVLLHVHCQLIESIPFLRSAAQLGELEFVALFASKLRGPRVAEPGPGGGEQDYCGGGGGGGGVGGGKTIESFGSGGGEVIMLEGSIATEMYFVTAGTVQLSRHRKVLASVTVSTPEGAYFGEVGCFLRCPRVLTARAVGPSMARVELYTISTADLGALKLSHPEPMSVLRESARRTLDVSSGVDKAVERAEEGGGDGNSRDTRGKRSSSSGGGGREVEPLGMQQAVRERGGGGGEVSNVKCAACAAAAATAAAATAAAGSAGGGTGGQNGHTGSQRAGTAAVGDTAAAPAAYAPPGAGGQVQQLVIQQPDAGLAQECLALRLGLESSLRALAQLEGRIQRASEEPGGGGAVP